jgi:cytochrome bd-type quinol oxidase subunit 2
MIARYDILACLLTPEQLTLWCRSILMRWKLLVLVSLAAAFIACGLWFGLVIGVFGTAKDLARNNWLLLYSAIVPLAVAAYSGVFVYRHTSRRRKTQATLTAILALLLSLGTYLVASQVFPQRLIIPRTSEVRQAR